MGRGDDKGQGSGTAVILPAVAAAGSTRRWRFHNVVFDERTLELTVDGGLVELERKPLSVLQYLLEHAGDVVTKDELLDAVWPGRVLSETVLTKSIARLRDALRDGEQLIIRTIHGYGYRLVAPVVTEISRGETPAHFDFKPGDHPPLRPMWDLVRRLGAGGHGEAWLVQHQKTRECRVFKFALDDVSLTALKREITLFRLLRDALGDHARIVTLFDWNLEQAPYFIESEFAPGGSLTEWTTRQGGARTVPLEVRIDIVAQVAEALAAVHSVGVLHKDLKPSNILVSVDSARTPQILLGDLGSGGILDAKRLELMKITRLGFTQTINVSEGSTGTPLYLAPELLAGQPPTVQADIYAMGVLLYQMVVGDLHRPLSSGWEKDVDDALLRLDIAAAAEGNPQHRLDTAADLARRLRSLRERRQDAERQRHAQAQAEAQRLKEIRIRARRVALIFAFVSMAVGLAVSTWLYRDASAARLTAEIARAKAEKETAGAKAVARFLSDDMFAPVNGEPLKALTVEKLLTAAAAELAGSADFTPDAQAQIHASLGGAFWKMEKFHEAEKQLDAALGAYERGHFEDPVATATLIENLVAVKMTLQRLGPSVARYRTIYANFKDRLGPAHPAVFQMQKALEKARFYQGDWPRTETELRVLLKDAQTANVSADLITSIKWDLGMVLLRLSRFTEAADFLRQTVASGAAVPGESQVPLTYAQAERARALTELERFDEAENELNRAETVIKLWARLDQSGWLQSVEFARGLLRLRQGRTAEAVSILRSSLDAVIKSNGDHPDLDGTCEWRFWLATALIEAGELEEAEAQLRQAVVSSAKDYGPRHPLTQLMRLGVTDVLRRKHDLVGAKAALQSVDRTLLDVLPVHHPFLAELHRQQGLIAEWDPANGGGADDLLLALTAFESTYGPDHALVRRAWIELKAARGAPPTPERRT